MKKNNQRLLTFFLKFALIVVGLLNCFCISAQELPPIENFSSNDYSAENQNWSISQSPDKLIYIANNRGLLEYDGTQWNLYNSPNETIMRSVHVVNDRIYTGCFMEFGYWKKNELGILVYTSVSDQLDVELAEDEEFWNIIDIKKLIVFQSLKRIYIYNTNDNSFTTIDSENTITKMYKVDQSIYFQRINKGIFKLEIGKDLLIFDDEVVKTNEVINIFKNGEELLILTNEDGFYRSRNNSLIRFENNLTGLLSDMSIYSGIRLKNNNYAIGTIAHGLLYFNQNGELLYSIDQNNGLMNNTVLSLFEDADNSIWLGLDNGISYVNINSPLREYHDEGGVLGSVYASAIFGGNLYLGTNQGLFCRKLDSNEEFSFIEGTQGQVWFLKEIDFTLFCGHNSGTFIVEGNSVKKISDVQGAWDIEKLNSKSKILLQGNYDGLYILEKQNDLWQLKNKIEGFDNSSRYFQTLNDEIFVNHEYTGIYKVKVDSTFSNVKNVSKDTLMKGFNSGIIKYNGDLIYADRKGVFKYDKVNKNFIKDSVLSKVYSEDEYVSGKMNIDDKENLWIFTNNNISFISLGVLTGNPIINDIPLTEEMRNGIYGYENVSRIDEENKYLFGTSFGYITIDMDEFEINDFQIQISDVVNGSNRKNKTFSTLLNKNLEGDFSNAENNLEISFYVPVYKKYFNAQYQFQLVGIYDEWSDWSGDTSVFFENLPHGNYTFNVRAKIGNKLSNNIASYSFEINKPFYFTNSIIALYVIGLLSMLFLMHSAYKRYYRKQRKKLIDVNKRALALTKTQNEKEIMRIKNRQLQSEIRSKKNELAASTMSIVKKNELLRTIKDKLKTSQNYKGSIKSVIGIINQNLTDNDDWEFFQEAFNNADSQFLKNIKALHQDLSPNDLKLCAYLRLNLSSKEISQILNISPRSVEVKRYRLRKRLRLSHKDNLVNYIQEL